MRLIPEQKRQRLLDVVPLTSPFTMWIDPSGCCNFKCKFCPCNNSEYNVKERHKIMPFPMFEKIIDDIYKLGHIKVVNLYHSGEPLLNPNIVEMVKLLRVSKVCDQIRIVTNGSLLTEELSHKLADSGVTRILISVEATSSEKYYEITGVKVDYEDLLRNVAEAYRYSRGKDLEVAAKLIVNSETSSNDLELFEKDWSNISDYCWIEEIRNGWYDFDVEQSSNHNMTFENSRNTVAKSNSELTPCCSWAFTNLTVYSSGNVSMCLGDWRQEQSLGNVNYQSLSEIWHGDKLRQFRIDMLTKTRQEISSICSNCNIKSFDDISDDAAGIYNKLLQVSRG